ncbi:hypothetical protein MCOR27_006607 [Pyricularia oryzae]|uniref:DUF7053 domain-containing protein n=2 Tax=Pyricularia TaxID=48558 RepID=A0ABQ8NH01_PYRGI|nr:hypothetical protein MCOR01_006676 [Pyricularia oryzae]KAI6296913.1 hypothetical protein MCOR33_006625 [Pyricularia grisea]KAH9435996.1 hypothetical protein MCOR02_004906 [Pyricularia oryzae]KAI6251967.1 hypothetical protein MCOR19_011412 [Pyricularia oryzae]KAI6276104.1 hypothetical protein MCOR34_011398 [Pyricularia oryzae]
MGVFSTTAKFEVWSEISGVSRSKAIAIVQDHGGLLNNDPFAVSVTELPAHPGKSTIEAVPEPYASRIVGTPRYWEVKDAVPQQFSRLLPGNPVTSNWYIMTDMEDGVYMYLEAPLGIVSKRGIVVRGGDEEGSENVVVAHECIVEANRAVLGVFKSQFEEHWRAIQEQVAKAMGGSVVRHSGPVR